MPLAALLGKRKWNVIFSKPSMVDKVIDSLVKLPLLPADDPGIVFTPVRRRALLITTKLVMPYQGTEWLLESGNKHGTDSQTPLMVKGW